MSWVITGITGFPTSMGIGITDGADSRVVNGDSKIEDDGDEEDVSFFSYINTPAIFFIISGQALLLYLL
jgi:hypothetical protein